MNRALVAAIGASLLVIAVAAVVFLGGDNSDEDAGSGTVAEADPVETPAEPEDAEPAPEPEDEPAAEPDEIAGVEPDAEPDPEPAGDPAADAAEDPIVPGDEPEPEPPVEPADDPAGPDEAPDPEPAEDLGPDLALAPVADPAVEPVADPADDPVGEPDAGPAAEPAAEPAADPAAEPAADPVVEPDGADGAEPAEDLAVEPDVNPVAEPDPEPQPVIEPADEPAADPPAEPDVAAAVEPDEEPAIAEEPVVVVADEPVPETQTLSEFVDVLAGRGIEFVFAGRQDNGGTVVLTDISITATAGAPVTWMASEATITGPDDGTFRLEDIQDLQLVMAASGGALMLTDNTAEMSITGRGGLALELRHGAALLALGNWSETSVGDVTIRFAGGTGQTPASLALRGLMLPAGLDTPFGDEISAMTVEFTGGPNEPATISGLAVRWGVFDVEATGALAVDAATGLSGMMDAAVYDVLTMLDAYHVHDPFDREQMADVYAALLLDLDPDRDQPLALRALVDRGEIRILGAQRAAPDLVLEGVAPIGWGGGE